MIHIVIIKKCRPSFTKSPSMVFKIDPIASKIQPFWKLSQFTKKCMAMRMLSETATGWPYISLLILTFLKRFFSVKTSLIQGLAGFRYTNFKLKQIQRRLHLRGGGVHPPRSTPVINTKLGDSVKSQCSLSDYVDQQFLIP